MNHQKKPHFWLMGPTASGKSNLSLQLSERKKSEIISVDSTLVYEYLNIGTAKPSQLELAQVKHHLIDICKPWQIYDVAQFCKDAQKITKQIEAKNKMPILSGGTFLYFRSLETGLSNLPASNKLLQQKWQKIATENGSDYLHQKLQKVDEISSKKFHPNDTQRIIRALVIFEQVGKPLSQILKKETKKPISSSQAKKIIKVALLPDTEDLKKKIASRFHKMIEMGLIEEVEQIIKKITNQGLTEKEFLNLPAIKSIGYQQITHYLLGRFDYTAMLEKAITATNQLAKRQRTWLRSEKNIHIFKDKTNALDFILKKTELN